MTLEAWVNPSVPNSGGEIVYKGNDNYYLEGGYTSGVPAIGIRSAATRPKRSARRRCRATRGRFLAATFDGATLRFYVERHAGRQPRENRLDSDVRPIPSQIGGDSIYGQFFRGTD